MSTAYILGAGASRHAGYPLASTMGTEMLSWMSSHEEYQGTADFIRKEFGELPNIEDVITELDARIDRLDRSQNPDARKEHSLFAYNRGELRKALPIWFREIHQNPATAYARFAEMVVQPGDVIITFNYDDSLERELKRVGKWDIRQGYGFQVGTEAQPTQVRMLKLHGSINWLVSIFGGITPGTTAVVHNGSLGHSPCIATNDLAFLGYGDMLGNFPGGAAFYSLVLPGRTKEFYYHTSFGREHEEFFTSLWSQAGTALRRADRLVLCGYSLLPVDQRACDLLLGTPRKDIEVVVVSGTQSQRIAGDFRAANFQNVTCYENGYFENWVREVASSV
jgi:hypothetical protein